MADSLCVRTTRQKVPSKAVDQDEVRLERAIDMKARRAGHLGDVRKRLNFVQSLLSEGAGVEEVIQSVECYERAFRKFVDAHETYLRLEVNEGMINVANESYEKEKENKFLLDVELSTWKSKMKSATKAMSKSDQPKSHRSSKTGRSSITSSVREKRRLLEEARLRVAALEQKQSLERLLEEEEAEFKKRELEIAEERERSKAELARKIEKMQVEMEVKKAAVDLEIEQEELQSEISERESVPGEVIPVLVPELSPHTPPLRVHLPPDDYITASKALKIDHEVSSASIISQSDTSSLYKPLPTPNSQPKDIVRETLLKVDANDFTPHANTPVVTGPPLAPKKEQISPADMCKSEQHVTLKQDVMPTPKSPLRPSHTQLEEVLLQTLQHLTRQSTQQVSQPQSESQADKGAWQAIADALRQGPTLPKIELMKFGGDPSEYGEFVVNFRDHIESQVSDDSQRLTRLLAQCVGRAKDAIKSCVNLPVGQRYSEAWKTLSKNFGQPHMVADAHMKRLRDYNLRRVDAPSLMEFARRLEDTKRVLTSMGPLYVSRLNNEDTILMLMKKLPDEGLKRKWTDVAGDLICSKGQVDFSDFLSFIQKRADRLNNRFGQELRSAPPQQEKERRHGNKEKQELTLKATTLATQSKGNGKAASTGSANLKCYRCSGPHAIWQCEIFKNASYEDRLRTVQQKKLCGSCLAHGHFSRSCPKGFSCRKPGCGKKHHSLLHPMDSKENKEPAAKQNGIDQQPVVQDQTSVGGTATALAESNPSLVTESSTFAASRDLVPARAVMGGRPRVCFKVVPVKVSGPGSDKHVMTYAFLDSGSDTTLCLRSLVEELSLESEPTNFTLSTVNYQGKEHGHQTCLDIEALDGRMKFTLDRVLTTESLPIGEKHFASNKELRKWPHLDGVSLPEIEEHRVSILIGSDRPDIIGDSSEIRRGARGQPYAVNTPFGWTVYGPMGEPDSDGVHVNFVRNDHEEMLSKQLEHLYNAEFGDTLVDVEQSLSFEDRRAKQIMDESVVLVNGHYQLKLPFRQSPPCLPDSLPEAKKRLYWLEKKMERDPEFRKRYASVVNKYQEEGSSRQVPDEEVPTLKPIWYLPHHAVWHPRKPDEPRVVFDCASKSKGISLNSQLLQGPENTSLLIGVILRFRINSVAVAADIKRMFHQVFVSPEDRGTLCYLWWPDGDLSKDPKTFQMLVHIFGATSSPSICGYALRRTAADNREGSSSETVDAVMRDFYVDDLLKSFETTSQAVEITKELQELLAKGGFQLTKVMSNEREVLNAFPPEHRAPAVKDLDLNLNSLPMDRALGIHWDVEADTFNLVVSSKSPPETRRGVMSSIATIYDPLGLVGPLILPGREINQELCRLKYDWNDRLPDELAVKWRDWKKGLASLTSYSIPRSFTPRDFGDVERAELHHFADASEGHGYGTVTYLRFVNKEGGIHNSFVMGKSRVRPLRSGISVPKMELTAATLLIKMNKLITKELEGRIKIRSVTFWTDSMIVLRYIFNEARRFVTFVANRVAVIREGSKPSQWRHVRSEANPADLASRGIKASETEKLEVWKHGPDFLWKDSREWPQQPADLHQELSDQDEEVKKEKITINACTEKEDFWGTLFKRYSMWERLRRVVAWVIRAAHMLLQLRTKSVGSTVSPAKSEQKTPHLLLSDVEEAERRIVKNVQNQSFPEELSSPNLSKSPLAKLKPFLNDGVLRVGGRLDRADLSYDAKHPMILPGKHRVTEMIILHYHFANGHVGPYQLLAETRQHFWIVKGVSSIRRVLRRCHECKCQNAMVGEQITAPLPAVRVSSDSHQLIYPFAAVGIDYFGPLYVHAGPLTRSMRKNPKLHKRYGCIFTCLRYRAVHIELASDLTTDSFINAVTRFVARRGPPRVIYSDNGSNFRGAETDVVHALKTWDQERIGRELLRRDIQWYFNPPAASHQGGVWERLIRSVRKILHAMIGEHLVNEETLVTFLVEVEKILNSRPITRVSSDPSDLEPLTPNHILLLRHNPCSAPSEFEDSDKFQARWKRVHILANEFWARWVKEYLPMLQERQKWLKQRRNFKVGDLVIMKDTNIPRGQWPKALVQETFPDSDGVVRQVLVRSATGVFRRDVRKLCLLEEELLKSIEESMEKDET